jgi:penicillin-insensitive murein endopeptidase
MVPWLIACSGTPARGPQSSAAQSIAIAPPAHAADPGHAHSAPTQEQAPLAAVTQEAAAAAPAAPQHPAPLADGPAMLDSAAILALDGGYSTSLGGPGHGKLTGSVRLPDSGPGFLHNPKRPDEARYGSVELVQAIVKAAAVVERELPGSVLVVQDLGLENGGPIRQHGSHQSGRDADILFYSLDTQGQPLQSVGVPIDPDGKGWDFKDLSVAEDDQAVRLDAPRTWRFVQAMLQGDGERVQRIFLVEHVRRMLLAQAERAHAPADVRERFADLTCQPDTPHDDHMHVRVFCSPEDIGKGCLDKPPLYPWHLAALQLLGIAPVLETGANRRADREGVKQRTTTPAQARKRAGPMHWKVRKFLAQREQWLKQPHPGRQYCR